MNISEKNKQIIFEKRTTEITFEELRELDSFKNYDNQQFAALIHTMKTFAIIVYHVWSKETNSGQVIELNTNEQLNKAA
jgi:hypothetical protein